MAKSLNRCSFIGRLVRDPEQRFLPDQTEVTSFTIACDDDIKDRTSGQMVERSEFIPISGVGNVARIANQYLKKGKPVYVEGKFTTRKWDDANGKTQYRVEIKLENMQMLGSGRDDNVSPPPASQAPAGQRPRPAAPPSARDYEDDIPF